MTTINNQKNYVISKFFRIFADYLVAKQYEKTDILRFDLGFFVVVGIGSTF